MPIRPAMANYLSSSSRRKLITSKEIKRNLMRVNGCGKLWRSCQVAAFEASMPIDLPADRRASDRPNRLAI